MNALLQVEGLSRSFTLGTGHGRRRNRRVEAVRDLSFALEAGECLAVVGPSGSGKSTLARLLLRLLPPDGGRILLHGRDLLRLRGRHLRNARRQFQGVFQDPDASLTPHLTVGTLLERTWRLHRPGSPRSEATPHVRAMLKAVGLPASFAARRPRDLSGGQRQRVAIARALLPEPDLLICDEPVSALDTNAQVQVLDLLDDLRRKRQPGVLFITHDLALVPRMARRVLVLDRGRAVEEGPPDRLLQAPRHPVVRSLVEAMCELPPSAPSRKGRNDNAIQP